jgi:hypothetical protein
VAPTSADVVIQDVDVISAFNAAVVFDSAAPNLIIRRVANVGEGLLCQMMGPCRGLLIEDCEDSVDPAEGIWWKFVGDHSRATIGAYLKRLLKCWRSKYSVYGGPKLDSPGPDHLTVRRCRVQGKNDKEEDTLHAFRLHRHTNTTFEDVDIENIAARSRTCFTFKEWGPLTLTRVRTRGADSALGPLPTTAQGDPPNWRLLELVLVNINSCNLNGRSYALDIDAGVHGLTVTGGSLSGSMCGMNIRGGYSGCVPDQVVNGKKVPAHPLPMPPGGHVRVTKAVVLNGVTNKSKPGVPMVKGDTSMVTVK